MGTWVLINARWYNFIDVKIDRRLVELGNPRATTESPEVAAAAPGRAFGMLPRQTGERRTAFEADAEDQENDLRDKPEDDAGGATIFRNGRYIVDGGELGGEYR